MNLDFTVVELCDIFNAQVYGESALEKNFKIRNAVIDTRNPAITPNTLFVALIGLKEDGHKYLAYFAALGGKIALVRKEVPSVDICQLVVNDPLEALQKLAIAHRNKFKIPVCAITGSNGKTIVKEWLYHTLKDQFNIVRSPKSYNSQIGVALSVLEITADHTLGIFEAGISKPGEMEKLEKIIQPTVGIFTGLGDAHDANFLSRSEKLSEKNKLFARVKSLFTDVTLLSYNIPYSDEASVKNASLVQQVALHFGIAENELKEKLKSLPAVSMRLEQIEGKNGCLILNDAYSSDLQSLEIAIKQLQGITRNAKKMLILTPLEDNQKGLIDEKIPALLSKEWLANVVFIGDESYLPQLNVPCQVYKSVDEFISRSVLPHNTSILLKGSRKYGLEKIVRHLAEKKHVTRLTINFTALRNNLNYFRTRLKPTTKILAMVKAQSYGGGLTEMAHFLVSQKVNYFGVAYADEGVLLRKSGITLPILVMNPEASAFDEIIDYDLEPSIYSNELLQAFINELILRQKLNYPIHLKIDSGMNRLGFVESQLKELVDTLLVQPEVFVKTVFSHLSVADDEAENQFTFNQIRTFDIMSGLLADRLPYKFERHLSNSAGTANFTRAEYDMVRLGIGLFGLMDKSNKELENVLSLTTQISQIKKVKAGESVGYGRSFIATRDQLIGIVPVGYADGLRRGLSQGNWSLLVKGKSAPIIGNICMDMCMISLEGIDAKTGDDVEVFGDTNSIFEMAMNLKTIPYEIISGISSRVHRIYVDE